jgi:rRNA maturation protein Nop10
MKEVCAKCNIPALNPKPAKFSPDDAYGDYRRKAKEEERKKRGLI